MQPSQGMPGKVDGRIKAHKSLSSSKRPELPQTTQGVKPRCQSSVHWQHAVADTTQRQQQLPPDVPRMLMVSVLTLHAAWRLAVCTLESLGLRVPQVALHKLCNRHSRLHTANEKGRSSTWHDGHSPRAHNRTVNTAAGEHHMCGKATHVLRMPHTDRPTGSAHSCTTSKALSIGMLQTQAFEHLSLLQLLHVHMHMACLVCSAL